MKKTFIQACIQNCVRVCLPLLMFASTQVFAAANHLDGAYANGARWAIDMPEQWNGTLLLYARGYSAGPANTSPETAPRGAKEWLLSQGYALAASSYSGIGWALQEAPQDQLDVLNTFTAKFGVPKRSIAWGNSMGGLTSVALAERRDAAINGAISLCGSVSGSLGMLNTALDGAFAFKTLVAPATDIRLVNVDNDMANSARVRTALESAWTTPQGRARVALAAALAQLPHWSDAKAAEPGERDYPAQAEEAYKTFVMGVFLPRVDQEQRAGGLYSWNTGVDYRQQLQRSGRVAFVRDMYRRAGLDLDKDLQTLNAAPRIAADPRAVAYMRANYVPTGQLQVPLLIMQTTGDGLTVPATHGSLREMVRAAGNAAQLGQLYVRAAGHCTFTLAEQVAALRVLEQRLDTGSWRLKPAEVIRSISDVTASDVTVRDVRVRDVMGEARFINYRPLALSRSCDAIGPCQGEPVAAPGAAATSAAWRSRFR